jgi:beta-lactamase superfamily II metal-dependent hydrolase
LKARLIAVLACLIFGSFTTAQAPFRIYFFDVGQGDAVFIQNPDGPNVLYDGGESPSRIIDHLDALSVSRIDLVVASHNHTDHIGGLAHVITRFRPRFYLDNGLPATTLTYRRVLEAVRLAGTQLLEPTRRDIRLGDQASLTVLPPSGNPGWEQNNNAIGLILTVGRFRMSLGGDAEGRQWSWWMEHYRELLAPVHVHKASHHGSTNGDTKRALALLSPEVVVISVGRINGYGHPRSEALRLYAAGGGTTYRTDVNGTITVEADPSGRYAVRSDRGLGTKRGRALASPVMPGSP